jgi:hypothetical protein
MKASFRRCSNSWGLSSQRSSTRLRNSPVSLPLMSASCAVKGKQSASSRWSDCACLTALTNKFTRCLSKELLVRNYSEFDKKLGGKDGLIRLVRDLWRLYCTRVIKLSEAFSYIQQPYSHLLKVTKSDQLSMIDANEEEDQDESTIYGLCTQLFRESLLSTKGVKILQAIVDDILFILQH